MKQPPRPALDPSAPLSDPPHLAEPTCMVRCPLPHFRVTALAKPLSWSSLPVTVPRGTSLWPLHPCPAPQLPLQTTRSASTASFSRCSAAAIAQSTPPNPRYCPYGPLLLRKPDDNSGAVGHCSGQPWRMFVHRLQWLGYRPAYSPISGECPSCVTLSPVTLANKQYLCYNRVSDRPVCINTVSQRAFA